SLRRASVATTNSSTPARHASSAASTAMASRLITPCSGLPQAKASDRAVAMPERKPVNGPGPTPTTRASMSAPVTSAVVMILPIPGASTSAWLRVSSVAKAASVSPCPVSSAALAMAEVSTERISTHQFYLREAAAPRSVRGAPWGRRPGDRSGRRLAGDIHHPLDAELVGAHAEGVAPGRLLQRFGNVGTIDQLVPITAQFGLVVAAERERV